MIPRTVAHLCKVNIRSLQKFCVEPVGASLILDGLNVVYHCMYFWDVEVLARSELNEHVLILMKSGKRGLERQECGRAVQMQLNIIDEVYDGFHNYEHCSVDACYSCDQADKHFLHLLVLSSCPLLDRRDSFSEVMEPSYICHHLNLTRLVPYKAGKRPLYARLTSLVSLCTAYL
jgi:hypothetical protein